MVATTPLEMLASRTLLARWKPGADIGQRAEAPALQMRAVPLTPLEARTWCVFRTPEQREDGSHRLTVHAPTSRVHSADDRIMVHVNRRGEYAAPARREPDYGNSTGALPAKHILETQPGPDENGHGWPPRRERAGVAQ